MTALSTAQRAGYTQDELDMLDGKTTPDAPSAVDAAAAEVESDSTQEVDAAADTTDGNEGSTTDAASDKVESAPAAQPEQAPAPKPQAFDVPDVAALEAQRKTLRTEKRDLTAKWSTGEVTDEEYADQSDALDDKLATLIATQTEAATLQRINSQNEARARAESEAAENQAMFATAQASKAAGLIDYGTNKVAAAQFDSLFAAAKIDPANAKLSAQQVVEKAHKAVLALNGLAEAPKPKQESEPAAAPVRRNIPQTLANLPAAAVQPVGQGLDDEFSAITDPDVAEAKWASLPVATRQQMLRSTVPARRGRH